MEPRTEPSDDRPTGFEWPADWKRALALVSNQPPTVANLTRWSEELPPETIAWAVTQASLRERARVKFDRASEMLFDREGLEMATPLDLARWHASLFPTEVSVVDFGCGIGGDLIALAERGPAIGVEGNAARRAYASHNLAVYGLTGNVLPPLRSGERGLGGVPPTPYVYLDPARRQGANKRLTLDQVQPDPRPLVAQTERGGLIKLSPLYRDEDLLSLGPTLIFVSAGGECREALVTFGDIQPVPPGTYAFHLESQSWLAQASDPRLASRPGKYIFDADPAAVRAHALGGFQQGALGDHPGYLTGEHPVESPWLRQYEVVEAFAFDDKRLRAWLRTHDARITVLKQRGTELDLVELRKRYATGGQIALTALFYRQGSSRRVVLARLFPG